VERRLGFKAIDRQADRLGYDIESRDPRTGRLPFIEVKGRQNAMGSNALASYIVLACRPRPADAPQTDRRSFVAELKRELPTALRRLQQGNIAPVDFAQAAIGPGMAIYSRYSRILEAAGRPMSVRTALAPINQTLSEVLSEQEDEFDNDTRWAIAWYEQHGSRRASSARPSCSPRRT
jgi:putative DNA methylase